MDWDPDAEWNRQNASDWAGKSSLTFRLIVLFLVIVSISYFMTFTFGRYMLRTKVHELLGRALALACIFLPVAAGYGVVALFKIRNTCAVRCSAWSAGIAGNALAFYAIYKEIEPHLTEADYILFEGIMTPILYAMPFFAGIFIGEIVAARSRFLFSEKTGQWLSSYRSKKRFAFASPIRAIADITVDDVLNSVPGKKKKESFSTMLFLDSVPDGEHFLKVTSLARPKNAFFSLKFSKNIPNFTLLPINRVQVEELYEKCGPFKKTFFRQSQIARW